MFGIPIDKTYPALHIFCDNQGLIRNVTLVESTLDKKHFSIAYHFTRWNVAASVINSLGSHSENLVDTLTKLLLSATLNYLFGIWMY